MPSSLENQFLIALSQGDLFRAFTLLEDLTAECSESHHRFLRALYKAYLSSSNYPEAFAEMMEIAADPDLTLQTALYICVEGSRLAFYLLDVGRMQQVLRLFKRLRHRHPTDPDLIMWTGSVQLNQANLAAHLGSANVTSLYRAAASALEPYDRHWCQATVAYSRLAVAYEYAGRSGAADLALQKAEQVLGSHKSRQELLLAQARIAFSRQQPAAALELAFEAHRQATRTADHFVMVEALHCVGEALCAQGQESEANLHLAAARDLALTHRLYRVLYGAAPVAVAR